MSQQWDMKFDETNTEIYIFYTTITTYFFDGMDV